MLISGLVSDAVVKRRMPTDRASRRPVAGTSCISPHAFADRLTLRRRTSTPARSAPRQVGIEIVQRRVLPDRVPVGQRKDHLQDLGGQLRRRRPGTADRRAASARSRGAAPLSGGRPTRSSRRCARELPHARCAYRSSPSASSYRPFASSSRMSGVGRNRLARRAAAAVCRCDGEPHVAALGGRVAAARELPLGEAAVIRVRVVGVDQPHARIGLLRAAPSFVVRARRPVEERTGGSPSAGKPTRRALEDAHGLGVVAGRVRRPAVLPRRALGARAAREPFVQLLERLRRQVVLVGDDVVGAEVVERLLGPRAVGKIGDERARQRDVLRRRSPSSRRRSGRRSALRPCAMRVRDTAARRRAPPHSASGRSRTRRCGDRPAPCRRPRPAGWSAWQTRRALRCIAARRTASARGRGRAL